MSRPSVKKMEERLKMVNAARRKQEDEKEREDRQKADMTEGAAFGRGQMLRRDRLRAEAAAEADRKKAEREERDRQEEQTEQMDLQAAIELATATDTIRVQKDQKKAVDKLLNGTAFHALATYDLLKALIALAAEWPAADTTEVVPPIGTKIRILVRRIGLDMTAAGLYRTFAGQLATGAAFRDGLVDMPVVRTKKGGGQPTEGKSAVVFAEVTHRLAEFLATGHGWEMGIPDLEDQSQMEPVTANIRHDREQWVKLAREDQIDIYFNLCRILQIPFRKAVWQACRCLTMCYQLAGQKVRFTTIEFSPTGKREGNKPPPAVDYYDQDAQKFAVCATLEERHRVDAAAVAKSVWFEEATEDGRRRTLFAVPVHFDYAQTTGKRPDPVTQATIDAIYELHQQSSPGMRGEEEEDCVVLVTAKTPPGKTQQYLMEHHDGTRLALMVANNLQQALQKQGIDPVGVGVCVMAGQVRLDIGTVLAVAGQTAAQDIIKRSKEKSLEVLKGIASTQLQFKLLSKPKATTADDEWEVVGRSSKVQRELMTRLVRATGCKPSELRRLSCNIREAAENTPLTLPGKDKNGQLIQAGELTTELENWAPVRPEDINDIRNRMEGLPTGKMVPLLIQIMQESGEVRIDYDQTTTQYTVALPTEGMDIAEQGTANSSDSEQEEEENETGPGGTGELSTTPGDGPDV